MPSMLSTAKNSGNSRRTARWCATPAVTDKYVYAVSEKGILYKLDITNGKKISSVPVGYQVYGDPYVEGDMVYIYARDHTVYAVDTVKQHYYLEIFFSDKVG